MHLGLEGIYWSVISDCVDLFVMMHRAYRGSKFVVANTLAKWKKLEPIEIDFSQDFSQKVVLRNCSVFNSLSASIDLSSADNLCKQFGPRSGPTSRRASRRDVGPDLDPNCLTF